MEMDEMPVHSTQHVTVSLRNCTHNILSATRPVHIHQRMDMQSAIMSNHSPAAKATPSLSHPVTHYIAAVFNGPVVGRMDQQEEEDAQSIVQQNLERYDDAARAARKNGAQIIVFPEWGLFGRPPRTTPLSKSSMELFKEAVGEVGENLAARTNDESCSIVHRLAVLAQKHSIVVVANVCEDNGEGKLFNTEVALSEDGILLAKYHKMNVFLRHIFDTPPTKEVVTFRTSFGVTFGLFVCFDLLWPEPQTSLRNEHNVTQFCYSVAFVDSRLTNWYYNSWAKKNQATLLASNLNGGSGIFTADGVDVQTHDGYLLATIAVSS